MIQRRLSLVVGVGLLALTALLRFTVKADVVPVTTVVIAPLVVAAVSTPLMTAAIGLAAVAVGWGLELDTGWGSSSLPRMGVIAFTSGLAVAVASGRVRRDAELVRRRKDSALARRLELALDAGSMGTWFYDAHTGVTVWDERLEAIHGLEPGAYDGTFECWIEHVEPEDRVALLAASDRALETGESYEVVYRISCPDGSRRWLDARGEAVAEDGRVVGTAGVVIDVTAQVVAAAELEEAREEVRRTLAQRNALGSSLQESLLPAPRVDPARIDVLTHYHAGERHLLLGGDFFDVIQRGESVRFIIGDVSGHSAYAAAVGTALRAGWRVMALQESGDPTEWVVDLRALLESETTDPECFATICTGSLTSDGLRLAVAGHPPPVLADGDGLRALPVPSCLPLGLGNGPVSELTVPIQAPFTLFLYTDGLIEGRAEPGFERQIRREGLARLAGRRRRE